MAVSASNDCWRFYKSGILSAADQCPTEIDHAVVAVGVDTAESKLFDNDVEEGGQQNCRRATRGEFRAKKCEGQGD